MRLLDELGMRIVSGEFEDQSLHTEAGIATSFGVGRGVVREAVKMLVAKGLLDAHPWRGLNVTPRSSWSLLDPDVIGWFAARTFSPVELRHLLELRIGIEPGAAKLAALNAISQTVQTIEKAYLHMVAAGPDLTELAEAQITFHTAILNASGNPFYKQCRNIVSTSIKANRLEMRRSSARAPDLHLYAKVLIAIKSGRGGRASTALGLILQDDLGRIGAAERAEREPRIFRLARDPAVLPAMPG